MDIREALKFIGETRSGQAMF